MFSKKKSLVPVSQWPCSKHEPFDHRFGMGEVDEQANSVSSGLQVVEKLCFMFRKIDSVTTLLRLHGNAASARLKPGS